MDCPVPGDVRYLCTNWCATDDEGARLVTDDSVHCLPLIACGWRAEEAFGRPPVRVVARGNVGRTC